MGGSAASQLHSRLMANGTVTVFTYGGRGDPEGIDSSGFCGGNVLEYAAWWKSTAVAAELGMWLVPNSSWEAYSRQINATDPSQQPFYQPFYPYAMPIGSVSDRFNFNMMYVKEFSTNTSLPRQFYRLPAHKHFSLWPKRLDTTCLPKATPIPSPIPNPLGQFTSPATIRVPGVDTGADILKQELEYNNGMLQMYELVLAENWLKVRQKPQFLNSVSDACVTTPSPTPSPTPTPTPSPTPSPTPTPSPSDVGPILLGILAVVIILVLGSVLFFVWKRMRQRNEGFLETSLQAP